MSLQLPVECIQLLVLLFELLTLILRMCASVVIGKYYSPCRLQRLQSFLRIVVRWKSCYLFCVHSYPF